MRSFVHGRPVLNLVIVHPEQNLRITPSVKALSLVVISLFGAAALSTTLSPIAAALICLLSQALLATFVIRKTDPGANIADLRYLYVALYTLYNSFYPLSLLIGAPNAFFSDASAAGATWLGCTGLLGMSVALTIKPLELSSKSFRAVRPMARPYLLSLLIVAGVIAFAHLLRGQGIDASSLESRRAAVDQVYSQTFVVAGYLLGGILSMAILQLDAAPRWARRMTVTAVATYSYQLLYFGFRLQVLLVFVSALVYLGRKPRVAHMLPLLALLGFLAMICVGFLRQAGTSSTALAISLTANTEFSYPMQTLAFYIQGHPPLRWGGTYLEAPIMFIPRAIYPAKGLNLAQRFLVDAFKTTDYMGFTFTLNTEAFLNFGYVGPFIVQFGLWIFISARVRKKRALPLWFMCLSVLAGEINRSEFSAISYALALTIAGAQLALFLGGIELPGHRLRLHLFPIATGQKTSEVLTYPSLGSAQ